jgi:4-hydroxymandelate oxidase
MARHNQPVFRKNLEEMRALVASTSLPFIAKGIMGIEDALVAVEAGAAAISVSNHGGRVQDHTPGVAEVLPEIASEVKGKVTVFADGGIRTGYDVLKMIALGADAVLVGRDLIRAAVGGGRQGVRIHMDHLRSTLAKAMVMTGYSSIRDVTSEILC